MPSYSRRAHQRPRSIRPFAAAAVAVLAAGALVLGGATAAEAVAVAISIQPTNATTQASGSEFDYQINLACSGTDAPSCDDAVVHIPLDSGIGMDGWNYDVSGGPAGFITGWHVDTAAHEIVVTLQQAINAGVSTSILLAVTPPNHTTEDGTTWSLQPTVSSSNADMDGVAPDPATGTATASVPLTVSKTAPQTFYRAGDVIDYTITATCPTSTPTGAIDARDFTVVDTLPAGLTVTDADGGTVSGQTITWTATDPADVPQDCGGTGSPLAASHTIQVTVGPVGTGAGEIAPKTKLTNSVTATADPIGPGDPSTQSATRDVVILGDTDDPFPGNAGLSKTAAGPLNISATATPDMTGTYPGRWLPSGDNTGRPASLTEKAPASYTLTPSSQNTGFEYSIVDPLPCLSQHSGVVYSSVALPAVCADPAFHVLGVTVQFGGANPAAGFVPQYRDTAGVLHDLDPAGSPANGWVVPTASIGNVAELDIPRDAQQVDTNSAKVQVFGYADASTTNGDILTNRGTVTWFVPTSGAQAAQASDDADLHILDVAQIGITKKMADIGGVTGTEASLDLGATLTVPSAAKHDLVVSDLLPVGTTLVTDPGQVTGTLSWSEASGDTTSTPALHVQVTPDFVPGQELVRIVLPVSEFPQEAGTFALTIDQLTVKKPSDPGVYTNTARVFYDDPDNLASTCGAGQYQSDDPQGSRDDATTSPINCSADATFRTANSASGQFDLVKTVQGDYDTAPQQFPNVGHVKLQDGTAQYAIHWTNNGAPTLQGVVLYDVFPFVGDTGVSGAQAGVQRGSQFTPVLAGVDPAPADTTIEYSASTNPCRAEVYPTQPAGCANDWTTDPSTLGGLDHVAALKVTSTASYATGEGISLGFQESVPTVSKDLIAWNSVAAFATTTDGTPLLPSESPKVGITASDERLTLDKTADVTSAKPGDAVQYTITVGNTGTEASVTTSAHDALPAGLTFVSADNGGTYDAATRTVTWSVPSLARDATLALHVTATVDAQQTAPSIANAASVDLPAGYSPTVVADPCADDPDTSCAVISVPVTPTATGLASTGVTTLGIGIGVAAAALAAGLVLVLLRRRRQA